MPTPSRLFHPRLVAWFLFVALCWILFRLPFLRAFYLYSVAEFLPGYVLVPLAGIYAGPAGVLGIVVGSLVSDALFGLWGSMTPFRAIAYGAAAFYAMRLWTPGTLPATRAGFLRFCILCIPIALTSAAWVAMGGALQRLYPFSYLLGLNTLNNLLSILIFAPAGYWLLSAQWTPRFGDWRSVTSREANEDVSVWGDVLIWAGAVSACALGVLISGFAYQVWPVDHSWVGLHTGFGVTVPVLLALLLQIVGAGLTFRSPSAPVARPGPGRFSGLTLPPISRP